MHIFFSNREHRAFERMMQEKPGHDHYDSGVDGKYPECRRCLYHQPYRRDRFCRYTLCPFAPERSTVRTRGGEAGKSHHRNQNRIGGIKLTKNIPRGHRQFLILLCALLLFSRICCPPAYADGSKDVEISYTVTEDMLPKASPALRPAQRPTPARASRPRPGTNPISCSTGLIASGSLLAGIGLFCYVKNKERTEYTDE